MVRGASAFTLRLADAPRRALEPGCCHFSEGKGADHRIKLAVCKFAAIAWQVTGVSLLQIAHLISLLGGWFRPGRSTYDAATPISVIGVTQQNGPLTSKPASTAAKLNGEQSRGAADPIGLWGGNSLLTNFLKPWIGLLRGPSHG